MSKQSFEECCNMVCSDWDKALQGNCDRWSYLPVCAEYLSAVSSEIDQQKTIDSQAEKIKELESIMHGLKDCDNCKHYKDESLCGCCTVMECSLGQRCISGEYYCEKWEY